MLIFMKNQKIVNINNIWRMNMECKSMLTIKGMENISVVGDMKIKISGYENIIKELPV